MSLGEAFRLGFLGYLFNLAPLGIVGGDLLKAILVARQCPHAEAKAVASVVVDRVVGLYVLFVVATAAILLTGFGQLPSPFVPLICRVVFAVTAAGTAAIALLVAMASSRGRWAAALARMPRIGPQIEHLAEAVRVYRRSPGVLALAAVMTFCVHTLAATGVYCIARGLSGDAVPCSAPWAGPPGELCESNGMPGDVIPWSTHWVIVPISSATSVIPLAVGPFEYVLKSLYVIVAPSQGLTIARGEGFIVALGYRLICVLIAAVGICYYLTGRRELSQAMREAQEEQELRSRIGSSADGGAAAGSRAA